MFNLGIHNFFTVSGFKSDVTVPVDDGTDALVRWDSYENFNSGVDGVGE